MINRARPTADIHGKSLAQRPGTLVASKYGEGATMPTTIEKTEEDLERERKKKEKTQDPTADELEPVSPEDLDERAERARREGGSGE